MEKNRANKSKLLLTYWKSLSSYVFFAIPMSTSRFAAMLFWHSFLSTITTPLFHWMNGRWRGELTLYWLATKLVPMYGLKALENGGILHPGIDYPREGFLIPDIGEMAGIDRSFAMHAFFWSTLAYGGIHPNSTFQKTQF